jgi:hypothetical protein
MARRIRTTVTVREDDPVPRRRNKKKSNLALILVVLGLLGLLLAKSQRPVVFHAQPAAVRH